MCFNCNKPLPLTSTPFQRILTISVHTNCKLHRVYIESMKCTLKCTHGKGSKRREYSIRNTRERCNDDRHNNMQATRQPRHDSSFRWPNSSGAVVERQRERTAGSRKCIGTEEYKLVEVEWKYCFFVCKRNVYNI